MANYTYTIGTDTAPVEINVKPDDFVSLNVEGELGTGQVFVDKTSAADVSIKAKLEAEGFATYTYKKTDVVAYRETIKETNRVVVTASGTPEAEGDNAGKYKVTTVTWALNEQGVLTEGAPFDDYLEAPGTSSTTSTFKKFTATYNGTEWVDNDGENSTETAPSVSYYTITSVANYNFTTNAYDTATPNDPVDAADAAAAINAQGTTYTRFATVGETTDSGTDITKAVTSATVQNPYAYAVNNNKYDTLTLFDIKNPTNIGKESYDTPYGEHIEDERVWPATVELYVNGSELEDSVLTDTEFDVTPSGTDFKGYANNDKAVSTDANETFKLGEGHNTIVLDTKQEKEVTENNVTTTKVVGIGNDVVTLTRGESLNLQFDDGAKIEAVVKGNDVVFSTVQYVAEATLNGTFDGQTINNTKFTFKLQEYNVETPVNATQEALKADHTVMWRATEAYNTTVEPPTHLYLDNTDFTNALVDGKLNTTYGSAGQVNDIHVYKVVNGDKTDITESYIADIKAELGTETNYITNATNDEYTKALLAGQRVAGTVTVKDIWNKDVTGESDFGNVGLSVNGVDWKFMISNYNNADDKFEIEAKNKAITGTYKDELAVSGKDGETINLGSGSDKVVFRGDFGSDTVTVNKNEELSLQFATDPKDIVFTTKGKDIVATANVKYYVTATASENFSYDGIDYTKDTVYTFEAKKLSQSGDQTLVNTYQWLGTTTRPANANENGPVGMVLEYGDIEAGAITSENDAGTGVRLSDISVYKSVNGGEGVKVTNFAVDYRNAEVAYNALINGTVTIKDYFGKDIEGASVYVNNENVYSYLKDYNADYDALEVKPNKKTFTGTFRDEVAISTKDNETINLGGGYNKVAFEGGNFGTDTIKLTKGENLKLCFGDYFGNLTGNAASGYLHGEDFTFTTEGNDVKTTSEVSYKVTATFTAGTYDQIEYAAGNYTFELKNINLSGNENLAPVPSYQWICTGSDVDGQAVYREETIDGKTAKISMILDYNDLLAGSTDANNVHITNIKVYSVINGNEFDRTDDYKAQFDGLTTAADKLAKIKELNAAMYETQGTGTVVLKDFNAKDIQAYVSIGNYNGDYCDIRGLYSFVAANTYDTQEAFAGGKITTKAQNDVIDASNYNSPNGKGVTINSGSGNDRITGSNYNDKVTVKSLAGDHTTVVETSGTNKITTGKGDDTVVIGNVGINPQITNNTIKLGNGENSVTVNANGKNKITGGSDDDEFILNNGFNTVNGKNGDNTFVANNGNNKLTGGKNVDTFTLSGGQNTVKAGKGDDVVTANFGYNTIDLGAGNDEVFANGGYNVIKASKGNNVYKLEGGSNVITGGSGVDEFIFNADGVPGAGLNAIINGGKGNDIYDLTKADYQDSINITDTKGKNVVKLAEKDTILFDVTLGKNAKKDKVSNLLTFRNDDGDVTYKGSIAKVLVADDNGDGLADVSATEYKLNIKGVAEQVASFMRSAGLRKGASAYDVLAAGGDNAAKLLAIYQGTGVDVGADTNKYVANIYA